MMVGMVLFWLDRKEKAYLWLCLTCCGVTLQALVTLIGNYTDLVPASVIFCLATQFSCPPSLRSGFSSGPTGSAWAACRGCTKWFGDLPLRCA